PAYKPFIEASDGELRSALSMIEKAKRPVLYIGGGIISAGAHEELLAFAEMTGMPVATTLMGVGAFPDNHPQALRWFGMHGGVAGNWAVYECDLLMAVGARFDDRITGAIDKFAPSAKIIHIDIDKSEHHKNKFAHLPIHGDAKHALSRLCEIGKSEGFARPDISEWETKVYGWKRDYPFSFGESPYIQAQQAIAELNAQTKGEAIIATGVGQHQMWAAQFCTFNRPRSFISSLGLGTMGFGLPAALGAKVAHPEKQVIDIDGDGSLLMNLQEMATAMMEKIPVKVMLINNQHLGMVMQWEDLFYNRNRGHTVLCDTHNLGGPQNPAAIYPDWQTIAKGFGWKGRRVIRKEEVAEAIAEMLASEDSYILELICPETEHVMPFIPAGKSAKDIIISSK
ncbi:MAG: acetolactate synthase large subunit, partial [Opitutales bacterium]|nr:acetolactate synthase large subunit [Opitutales bacterium]